MGQYYRISLKKDGVETVYGYNEHGHTIGKLMKFSFFGFCGMNALCDLIYKNPTNIAFVGDYADEIISKKEYDSVWGKSVKAETLRESGVSYNADYLVNHTKQIYIDLKAYREICDRGSWCVHPLPLLTAIGNGKGGGDYSGLNESDIGTWANDLISIEDKIPDDYYEEEYEFVE